MLLCIVFSAMRVVVPGGFVLVPGGFVLVPGGFVLGPGRSAFAGGLHDCSGHACYHLACRRPPADSVSPSHTHTGESNICLVVPLADDGGNLQLC